jgi:hypothetical protein
MRIWSNVGAVTTGLKIFRTSWFIGVPFRKNEGGRRRPGARSRQGRI